MPLMVDRHPTILASCFRRNDGRGGGRNVSRFPHIPRGAFQIVRRLRLCLFPLIRQGRQRSVRPGLIPPVDLRVNARG